MPLEPIEFRSPIATIEFSNGRKLPVTFDEVWQRRFKALWDLLDGLVDESESSASDGMPRDTSDSKIQNLISLIHSLRRSDNGGRTQEAKDAAAVADRPKSDARIQDASTVGLSALLSPPKPPFDVKEAILAAGPVRRDRNVFTFIPDTAANLTNYTAAAYPSAIYFETDTFVIRWSNGSAWTEFIFPSLIKLLGSTSSFPALKRSAAILQARLADDSAHTDLEVLDEAYGAPWNGSLEVPTKNAVYDKVETLLSQNGVNFGPAAVASITIVNGQVTAVS